VGGYVFGVRPRLLRWGETDDEARRPYPGEDLVPAGARSATMASTRRERHRLGALALDHADPPIRLHRAVFDDNLAVEQEDTDMVRP
jgi:hypothetical protein